MNTLDFIVVGAYLALMLGLGFWLKDNKSEADYFLGGKSVGWFPLAMSGIGSTVTLSNFVAEEFCVSVVSVAIPWVHWFLARFQNRRLRALWMLLTFLPIVTALAIRLSMPTLPE